MAVSAWFAFERWTFTRHRGTKWLMDVLTEVQAEFSKIPPITWISNVPLKHIKQAANATANGVKRASASFSVPLRLVHRTSGEDQASEDDKCTSLPTVSPILHSPTSPPGPPLQPPPIMPALVETPEASQSTTSLSPTDTTVNTDSGLPATVLNPAQMRLATVVRSVMMKRRALQFTVAAVPGAGTSPRKQRTLSSHASGGEQVQAMRTTRVAALIPALRNMEPVHDRNREEHGRLGKESSRKSRALTGG